MITKTKIAGISTRVLMDYWAEVSHLSLGFGQHNKIITKSETATAEMANGSIETLRTTKIPLTVNIESYTIKMHFVASTQTYDLILGYNSVTNTKQY